MPEHRPWWLAPLIDLVIHLLIGSVLFAVVFAPAVVLELLLEAVKGQISETLMAILKATKIAVAGIDAVLYIAFIVRMGIEFLRDLFSAPTTPNAE